MSKRVVQRPPADPGRCLDYLFKLLLRILKILVWILDFETLHLELFVLLLLLFVDLLFHILVTFGDLLNDLGHLAAFELLDQCFDAREARHLVLLRVSLHCDLASVFKK